MDDTDKAKKDKNISYDYALLLMKLCMFDFVYEKAEANADLIQKLLRVDVVSNDSTVDFEIWYHI